MKKKILLIGFILATYLANAQSKYIADRYFNEFNYLKSVELYRSIYDGGDRTELVLSRIADSYYFNQDTKFAEIWYNKLFKEHKNTMSPDHLFRYAQVLSSNGNYHLADSIMIELGKYNNGKYLSLKDKYNKGLYNKKAGDVVRIHNLSTNTKYSDFGGFFKENKFYFASAKRLKGYNNREWRGNKQPYLNLYKSKFKEENNIVELDSVKPVLLTSVKTKFHESNAVITSDGKTMYFTRDNYNKRKKRKSKDKIVKLKLYKATRNSNVEGWHSIEELPFNSKLQFTLKISTEFLIVTIKFLIMSTEFLKI